MLQVGLLASEEFICFFSELITLLHFVVELYLLWDSVDSL